MVICKAQRLGKADKALLEFSGQFLGSSCNQDWQRVTAGHSLGITQLVSEASDLVSVEVCRKTAPWAETLGFQPLVESLRVSQELTIQGGFEVLLFSRNLLEKYHGKLVIVGSSHLYTVAPYLRVTCRCEGRG